MNNSVKILGVNLPSNKKTPYSLAYLYGIGVELGFKICSDLDIDPNLRINTLSQEQLESIKSNIESNYVVEGELRLKVQGDIKSLIAVKCHRGTRHRKGLPVRGQRTKTNARTRKGKRKTVSSLHKK